MLYAHQKGKHTARGTHLESIFSFVAIGPEVSPILNRGMRAPNPLRNA